MRTLNMAVVMTTLMAILGMGGVSHAQGLLVPPEWAGVWQVEITYNKHDWCDSLEYSCTDTLCTGEGFAEYEGQPIPCLGTVDADHAVMWCERETMSGFCPEYYRLHQVLTRNGDTITGSGTLCRGKEDPCTPSQCPCMSFDLAAVRTSSDPAACDSSVPVHSVSWGLLKDLYR